MNSELQAMMARRRKMAEGGGGSAGGGEGEAKSSSGSKPQSMTPPAPSQVRGSRSSHPAVPPKPSSSAAATVSPKPARQVISGGAAVGASDDLQAIFERRRRLSETGAAAVTATAEVSSPEGSPPSGYPYRASSTKSLGQSQSSLSQSSSSNLRVQIPPGSSPIPDAKTSPVKPELKKVAIDPALRAAMERRRNLIVDDDDDGDDDINDDSVPAPPPQPTAGVQTSQRRDKRAKDAAASGKGPAPIPPVRSIHSDDAAILQDDDDDGDDVDVDDDNDVVGNPKDSFDDFDQELKELETPRPSASSQRQRQPQQQPVVKTHPASTRSTQSDEAVLMFPATPAAAAPAAREGIDDYGEEDEDETNTGAVGSVPASSDCRRNSKREERAPPSLAPVVSKASSSSVASSTAPPTVAATSKSGERRSRSKEGRELDAMVMMATKAAGSGDTGDAQSLQRDDGATPAAVQTAAAVPPASVRRESSSGGEATGRRSDGADRDRDRKQPPRTKDRDERAVRKSSREGSGSDSQEEERAKQEASIPTTSSSPPPPENTSLQSLNRKHRRRSVAGGGSGGGSSRSSSDDDDYSRADSTVVSAVSGTDRPSGRRSGRRRQSTAATTASVEGAAGAAAPSSRPMNRRQSSVASLEVDEDDDDNTEPRRRAPRPRDEPEEQQRRGSDSRSAGPVTKPRRSDYGKQGRSPSIRSMDSSDDAAQPPPKPRRDSSKPSASSQSRSAPDPDPTGISRASKVSSFTDSASDMALDAWGDLTSAFPNEGGAASGAFDPGSQGFANFPTTGDDAGFDAFGTFPVDTKTAAKTSPPVLSNSAFASFGADDGFGGADFGFGGFDAQEPSSQPIADPFSVPQKPTWDTSPLLDVPVRPAADLHLVSRPFLSCSSMVGSPITNPLNGNIIFCTSAAGSATIHEVNPHRSNVQVASTAVVTSELQRRIATKYNVSVNGLAGVVTLASGVHVANGQARLRVAAIVDLRVIESPQPMRIVAVWQWGYGAPNPISVQFALTPPSGGDFTHDAAHLQVADGLIFVGGYSPKGPCIFSCKPTMRETWSVNFLGGSGRITCMSVTPSERREMPYIAVGLSDRSVSIWTYKGAIGVSASKAGEASTRWLLPLCQLDAAKSLMAADAAAFHGSSDFDVKDAGCCTHLAWLPTQPAASSSILLLACSFQNGLAVFHVGLPSQADVTKGEFRPFPEPTQSTTLPQAPVINPLSVKRWQGRHEMSSAAWLQLGPHVSPCLAVLLRSSDSERGSAVLLLVSLMLPVYRHGPQPKDRTIAMELFATLKIEQSAPLFPTQVVQTTALSGGGILCRCAEGLVNVSLSRRHDKIVPFATTIGHAVSSDPPGLSSVGEPFLSDAMNDADGILHVYTVLQCERQRSESTPNLQEWGRPRQRHWLCRTLAGDTKATSIDESKDDRGFGPEDSARGGATSSVVCELLDDKLEGLVPSRLVRCKGASMCAVLFTTVVGKKATVSFGSDATALAFVDYAAASAILTVVPGRDVAFWPQEDSKSVQGVILSADGTSLTSFTWSTIDKRCNLSTSHRPILGVDLNEGFIECRRVASFSGASMLSLGVLGTRSNDGRWCFSTGELLSTSDVNAESWSKLLPNVAEGPVLWFDDHEEVFSVVGLEHDDGGYRNFALATSTRVLIASSGMDLLSTISVSISAPSISPLGSFAVAFISDGKLRYLSCLDGNLASGTIATLPVPQRGLSHVLLLMIRPDRFLYSSIHGGSRLIEFGQNPHSFFLPTALTKPALLLEPLVANAICVGGKLDESTPVLRVVIEKFGRKLVSTTHAEDEGIGNVGAGITPRTFEMLNRYGLEHANSWLLTGVARFDRSINSRIMPAWLPLAPKAEGATNSDAFLHVVSNGDQYLSDYIKTPESSVPAPLPRSSGPIAYACRDSALESIRNGRAHDALKSLDVAGGDSSERLILDLAMAFGIDRNKDTLPLLKAISGVETPRSSRSSAVVNPSASLAALAVCLKQRGSPRGTSGMTQEEVERWMKPLAPSLQRGVRMTRPRQTVFSPAVLQKSGEKLNTPSDPIWATPCSESKHVWNEGPRKEKNNLLLLDSIEEWLGRRRPVIVGKEGASAARDRGDKTLADILNKDEEDSFGGKSDLESERDGWVDGVGEGRSDEANLSAYFRMSEGENEDSKWRTEGIEDLSPFQNKAKLVGDTSLFSLQPTTSSVDEGEPGKVKALYDLVFDKASGGTASGLVVPAHRGSSVDVGAFHSTQKSTRHKCSIEFWYYLPPSGNGPASMVLARRTFGPHADEASKACVAASKDAVLWELLLSPNGELEFRTCGGSSLRSSQKHTGSLAGAKSKDDDDSEGESERRDLATTGRWNHVCIVMAQDREDSTMCSVSMIMKGIEVASSTNVSLKPSGFENDDLGSDEEMDRLMKKSLLVMGLNHGAGFRLTEIRVWACERSAEDTQSMLYEYLNCAEAKKKFKVKISSKKTGTNFKGGFGTKGGMSSLGATGGAAKAGGRGLLAPTKSGAMLPMSKGFSLAPQRAKVAPALATEPQPKIDERSKQSPDLFPSSESTQVTEPAPSGPPLTSPAAMAVAAADFAAAFGGLKDETGSPLPTGSPSGPSGESKIEPFHDDGQEEDEEDENDEQGMPATLWDTAVPLSHQVRSSAAAAIIRGPPATRHFGGNRGGLPDFSGMDRFGVGGIAICGSEKTIVWRDNEDPPALTYPIGASGAVVSDLMDDEGSEFLCCFLAKEKRMVVFELQSRTVVVELQMTTKLNFWRFLPPEAAENTLCFMLVTPVGGFHWMPLEESPRPHQVWKRGPELQGKKVVSYEEGGSNGLDASDMLSRVGLVMVTQSSGDGALEAWIVPVDGDSQAGQVSDDVMGACFCQPPYVEDGPFLPLLMTVHQLDEGIYVNVLSVTEPKKGSVKLGEIEVTRVIEETGFEDVNFDPPDLAMGSFPEAICCSLGNIVVIVIRRKGLIAAFELEEDDLSLIALEGVGHYVIDAVMRYSAEVGGAEIVMLLSDEANPKDGRMVSFCFRSAV